MRTCPPPRRADAAELRRRVDAGEWVVDLRARRAFAAGHVAGTLSFDLDGSFATYLGWLIPWGTPLTLLGQTPGQVAGAQRELVRIGIDRPAAAATGHPGDWAGGRALRSYPVADFAGLESVRRHRPVVILDVRRDQEWNAAHIEHLGVLGVARPRPAEDGTRGPGIGRVAGDGAQGAEQLPSPRRRGCCPIRHEGIPVSGVPAGITNASAACLSGRISQCGRRVPSGETCPAGRVWRSHRW